ncbi:hypothetical protein SAMN05421847_1486 [Halpernia humi]|uniref:Lipocalin-like domain-containing protein n=2 Tax=Halpernia humi TaxID=493375 RepID=A0A1H5XMG1_9FLAO|nr:hypothetical protein SAMN05421847_1486 [Halpernia humi]
MGNWKVVKVLNELGNKDLTKGFNSSIFKFDKNFNFALKSSDKNPLFSQIESMTKNSKWKIDPQKNRVKIGNKNDNYTTMFIEVERKNEKTIFHLTESNINLEVEKIEKN